MGDCGGRVTGGKPILSTFVLICFYAVAPDRQMNEIALPFIIRTVGAISLRFILLSDRPVAHVGADRSSGTRCLE
jgi:hypothetical protein